MKTKFGSIIVAGSGKIGGHVASKNRGGSFLRTKVTPANPQTISQLGVRSRFTALSQAWRGLTQAQRDAWNAATPDFARTDIFGDLRNPSGINLYQRLNNMLLNLEVATLDAPPSPAAVQNLFLSTASAAVAIPAMTVTLNAATDADTNSILFATAPMSAGKSSVASSFRQIYIIATGGDAPVNVLAAYTDKFGSVGEVGQKIFFKLKPVNTNTGQVGGVSSFSVITVA